MPRPGAFLSHPPVIVRLMDRHTISALLPGALLDAFSLALALVLLYVTVVAAATFGAA